jgi:FMN-dependent NADH-azoreductase
MSSAFIKESEEQWLHEIPPTLNALIVYLTKENNGVHVYEKNNFFDAKLKKTVHVMSNGGSYATDDESKWRIL